MKQILFLALVLAVASCWQFQGTWKLDEKCQKDSCPLTYTADHQSGFECPDNTHYLSIRKSGSKWVASMYTTLENVLGDKMEFEFDDSNWGDNKKTGYKQIQIPLENGWVLAFQPCFYNIHSDAQCNFGTWSQRNMVIHKYHNGQDQEECTFGALRIM